MDRIDIRDLIVRTLKDNEFNTTDQTGNELRIVEDCDFVEIAETIVKNLPIYDVIQQREQFFALLRYTMPDQFTDVALKNIVKGFIEQSK